MNSSLHGPRPGAGSATTAGSPAQAVGSPGVPFNSGALAEPPEIATVAVTNLTGHPCVALPHGFDEKGHPTSLSFIGQLYGDAEVLALARAYQNATGWHLKHPNLE